MRCVDEFGDSYPDDEDEWYPKKGWNVSVLFLSVVMTSVDDYRERILRRVLS